MRTTLPYISRSIVPVILLTLVFTLLLAQPVHAQPPRPELSEPPDRPPMPDTPPPRPEIPATVSYQNGGNGSETGQIQAQTNPGAHTVVQWRDGAGNWHDVEGWRTQSTSGTVVWTVEEKDFGTGPFRWVSYAYNGRIVAVSQSFNLPKAGQTVSVSMGGQWQGGETYQEFTRPQTWQQQPPRWTPPRQWQPRYPQHRHPHWHHGHPQPHQWRCPPPGWQQRR